MEKLVTDNSLRPKWIKNCSRLDREVVADTVTTQARQTSTIITASDARAATKAKTSSTHLA